MYIHTHYICNSVVRALGFYIKGGTLMESNKYKPVLLFVNFVNEI